MEFPPRRFPSSPIIVWSLSRLLHTTFMLYLIPLVIAQEISYEITEEVLDGFRVGNLVEDLQLEVDSDTLFQFLSTQLPNETYFTLDERTGELKTSRRIDREDPFLCPVNQDVCTYDMEILVLPVTSYRFINVHVTILDTNDHTPTFPDPIMGIAVPESVAVGTRIPMENAFDPDIGNNTVQNYYLSQDYDGTFGLFVTRYIDGSFSIQLEVKASLDREARDHYELLLLAVDGGTPQANTGSTILNITVLDSNDHHPTFKRSEYTVNIAENLDVGTEILKVEASDPDLGTNGQIIYGFSGTVPLFAIESDTGVIRTSGRVDYETDESFQLIVKCTNNVPNPVADFAAVTINIIDVNDNRPLLSVTAIEGGGNYIHMPETAAPGTLIAFVRVSDPDSGSSGEVRLLLSGHYDDFELQTVNANQYFLATKRELDREELAVYNVTIVAEDKGDPILWRQRKFAIFIDDVNDNAPFFTAPIYYLTILENNAPNSPLTAVLATDEDEGENATVVYSLPGNQHGFSIDPESGEIMATSVLDREVASSIALTVAACDKGSPRLCDNVTVMVDVLDENDNPPEFLLGTYEFGVYENQKEGSLVGQVRATDSDIGDNSDVSYTIKTEGAKEYFRIDGSSGEIFTKVSLDREVQASYAMVVTAKDGGLIAAQQSSSVTVLISVLDRNDNAPRVIYPNAQDDAVFIPMHAIPGFHVAQMEAEDFDDGPNSRLSYSILDGNIYDIFEMKTGGQLVTIRMLKQQWEGVHFINLRVKDGGASSSETTAQLIVVIANMNFNESLREDTFFQLYNMTVDTFLNREAGTGKTQGAASKWPVVAVIALGSIAFVLLMIFLVVATKCRDKNKNRENQYTAPTVNTTDDMSTGSKPPSERKTSGTNSTNISLATSQSSIPSKNIQKWKSAEKNGSVDSRLGNKQMTTFGSNSDVCSDSMQSLHSNSNRRTPIPDPDAEVQKLLNKLRHQDGSEITDDFSHSSCDSGHGDSDRDTRESNGTNSMSPDMSDLQNGRTQSLPRLAPLAQISGRSLMNSGGERGSYAASSLCTPECRTLGHSDLCWSQNTINGRPKSDSFSSPSSSSRTLPITGRSSRHQDYDEGDRDRPCSSKQGARESPSRQPTSRDGASRDSASHLSVPTARMGAHTAVVSPNNNQSNHRSSPSKSDDNRHARNSANTPAGAAAATAPLTPISEHPEDSPFDYRGGRTHKGDKSSRSRGRSRAEREQGRINNSFHPEDRQRTPCVTFKDERTSTNPNGSYSSRPNHRHAPSPVTNNGRNNVHGLIVEASGYGSHSSVSSESSSEVNSHGGYSLDDLDGVLERCEIAATDAQFAIDKTDQVPFTDWV